MEQASLNKKMILGLIGITGILLQNLLTMESAISKDDAALVSVTALAMALPLLCFAFLIREQRPEQKRGERFPTWVASMTVIGVIADLIGITAAFCRIAPLTGIAFGFSSLLASILYISASTNHDATPQEKQAEIINQESPV